MLCAGDASAMPTAADTSGAAPAGSAAAGEAGPAGAAGARGAAAGRPAPGPRPGTRGPGGADASVPTRYEAVHVLGSGAFGTVFMARDRETGGRVALKRLMVSAGQDGVPGSVIREVSLLRDLVHPNIVRLKDLQIVGLNGIELIFEYIKDDLHQVLKGYRREGTQLPMEKVVRYSQDLLNGIHACHTRMVIHRDLKPQNVLIHPVDGLKICDFGMARLASLTVTSYTQEVVTLWYRGPELLLGHPTYDLPVDMWSAGCVLAEIATGCPTFPGDSEIGTLFKIMQLLGSPTEATWPGFETSLPLWSPLYPSWPPSGLKTIRDQRPELGDAGMDLVRSLLTMNPAARSTARKAKAHACFSRPGSAPPRGAPSS
ncbi:unnamed protein product [Prorocentrum cordatum]|uniref:Cyclin-dependent kinase 2 homolog n=1 Tax=Prorocentrum cordatum TaxID=2364126 RepID=A0ABN9SXE9_9DINO|nr:unnamed protein product [Polarella glacialis]